MSEDKLTVAEAAELTGYSAGHVRYLIRNDKVDAEKIGQRVYVVDRQSLVDYANKMEALGTEKHAPGQ
jgi:excisionase family DNA binding protein